jgi:hypothetical protein
MSERLSTPERNSALDREAAYSKYAKVIRIEYSVAQNKSGVTDYAQIYVDEHEMSTDPIIQGRVDAYQDFLKSLGRAQ